MNPESYVDYWLGLRRRHDYALTLLSAFLVVSSVVDRLRSLYSFGLFVLSPIVWLKDLYREICSGRLSVIRHSSFFLKIW